MEKRSERIERQRKLKWEKLHIRKFDFILLPLVLFGLFGYHQLGHTAQVYAAQKQAAEVAKKHAAAEKAAAKKAKAASAKKNQVMRAPISWKEPSEVKSYPDLNKVSDFWVKVKLKKNRTYLMSGNKVIYTMYSSGGMYHDQNGKKVSDTPTGTFHIQKERGDEFFNQSLNEGAKYWVSWKDHGVYLFHSVPTLKDGKFNIPEAEKLGKEPASHGCIRLSVPDAKWMMEHLKEGTKVVVEN